MHLPGRDGCASEDCSLQGGTIQRSLLNQHAGLHKLNGYFILPSILLSCRWPDAIANCMCSYLKIKRK